MQQVASENNFNKNRKFKNKYRKKKKEKKQKKRKKNRLFPRYERDSEKWYTVRKPRVANEKGKHQTRTKTRVRLTAVRTRELILRGAPSRGAARRTPPSRYDYRGGDRLFANNHELLQIVLKTPGECFEINFKGN